MKVNLKDIARATGFSLSTVSLALRGKGRISEQNRSKILVRASEMGYKCSPKKKSVSKNRHLYFALIMQLEKSEFYPAFYKGFTDAAHNKNIEISLFNVFGNNERVEALIKNLIDIGYSAAVLFIPSLKQKQYQLLQNSIPEGFPVISCSNINNPVLDTVTFDAYSGAYLVAKHFYSQKFRRFGIIEGPQNKPEALFRTNGFTDFTKQRSDSKIVWSYIGDYTRYSGVCAFDNFENATEKPEAIFAVNDAMAVSFLDKARSKGWIIPEDLAIAGYDNLPMSEYNFPNISSVKTDFEALGENAIAALLDRLNRPRPSQGMTSLLPVSLEVRESSKIRFK